MNNLNEHMQRAVHHHQQGAYSQAEELYREALKHYPKHDAILNLMATLYAEQARYDKAIPYFKKAIRYSKNPAPYQFNLGEAFCRNQQFQRGVEQFQKLLSTPQEPQARYALAKALSHLERYDEACLHYAECLNIHLSETERAERHFRYGSCLEKAQRYRSAIQIYRQGLVYNPQHGEMHFALAELLFADKQFAIAVSHYEKTLALDPHHGDANFKLWRLYTQYDQRSVADSYRNVLLNQYPQHAQGIKWQQNLDLPIIPQSISEKQTHLERLQETLETQAFEISDLDTLTRFDIFPPYILAYYGLEDRSLRERFAQRIIETGTIPQFLPAGKSRPVPRVGFLVTSGHEGVFMKCMTGLIKQLQSKLDLTVVCVAPLGKTILSRALPHCTYLELPKDILQAAKALQKQDFDLLYYWEIGTDAHNYFLPFFQTARKQVASWGWPVTSGIPYVDAFFSCEFLEPSSGDLHYSERLYTAERLLTFYTPPHFPPPMSRETLGVNPETHLYLCTQNLRKIQPEMDPLLTGILKSDPQAQLFFIGDKLSPLKDRLAHRWSQAGLDLTRIHFLSRMEEDTYLQWVQNADVILDTPCYTGGANTNYDAFQAGTPVVTREGSLHRARYTAGAYRQMGETTCITHDDESYIQKATQLARDPEYRHTVSESIAHHRHQLFEDPLAVKACMGLIDRILEAR